MRADDPFCEASDTWATTIAVPRRFVFIDAPAAVAQLLETDPQQLLSVMVPWTENSAHFSEVVIYGVRSEESYVSITNFLVTAQQQDESKNTTRSVLQLLRVPDIGADELLRHLTAPRLGHSDPGDTSETPTPPELVSALEDFQSDRYEAALGAALS